MKSRCAPNFRTSVSKDRAISALPTLLAGGSSSAGRLELAVIVMDGFDLFDLAAITDTFAAANRIANRQLFSVRAFSVSGTVAASCNVSIVTDQIGDLGRTLNVALLAGKKILDGERFPVLKAIRRKMVEGARILAIGSAGRILAEGGLVRTGRLSAHLSQLHAYRELLGPHRISSDIISCTEGVITCVGMEATIDVCLAAISQEYFGELAYEASLSLNVDLPSREFLNQKYYLTSISSVKSEKLQIAMQAYRSASDEILTAKQIARRLGVGVRQLQRLFVQHIGIAPHLYSLRCRLERAQQLLQYTGMSVTEVAVASGFVSVSHFSQKYRRRFGVRPRDEMRLA